MNQLTLPEPQYLSVTDRYGYHNGSRCTTPYEHLHWTKIVSEYGVKLPEVVDMTCGFSKCDKCNAVYVGWQPECNRQIEMHKTKDDYWSKEEPGYKFYAEKNFVGECKGYLKWDQGDKFEEQKRFFNLLESIRCLPNLSQDPLFEFQERFVPGTAAVLRERLLKQQVDSINAQLPMIADAIRQIAEKMNAAGNCLNFNF